MTRSSSLASRMYARSHRRVMTNAGEARANDRAGQSDEELVAGYLDGEVRCFDALHERCRSRVYGFAVGRLGDPSEAEDLTQEVFLQVFRCLGSFEWRSNLLSWIFGIARNEVCRALRHQKLAAVSLDERTGVQLSSGHVPVDRRVEVLHILERRNEVIEYQLSPSQRQIFRLEFVESRATRAIAQELGKSNQAVKISFFRTRRVLAERTPNLALALGA